MSASLALPLVLSFRAWPRLPQRAMPTLSALIAVLGLYWFFQRVMA